MDENPNDSGSEEIDLDRMLYKLQEVFNFTSEVALNAGNCNLVARIQAAQALAQIATAIGDLLNAELTGFMMGLDDPNYVDPSLDPDSTGPASSPPKDDELDPSELDID